jgi:hypothetical protein
MRRTTSTRLTAAATASLWVLGLAFAAIHGAVDRHTYCATHQAFEEAAAAPAGPAPAAPSAAATIDAAALELPHAPCPFADALGSRSGALTPPPASAVGAPPCPAVLAVPVARAAGSPVPLLHTAPKLPPPTV